MTNYDTLSVKKLKAELTRRKLKTEGLKAELKTRLEEDDSIKAASAGVPAAAARSTSGLNFGAPEYVPGAPAAARAAAPAPVPPAGDAPAAAPAVVDTTLGYYKPSDWNQWASDRQFKLNVAQLGIITDNIDEYRRQIIGWLTGATPPDFTPHEFIFKSDMYTIFDHFCPLSIGVNITWREFLDSQAWKPEGNNRFEKLISFIKYLTGTHQHSPHIMDDIAFGLCNSVQALAQAVYNLDHAIYRRNEGEEGNLKGKFKSRIYIELDNLINKLKDKSRWTVGAPRALLIKLRSRINQPVESAWNQTDIAVDTYINWYNSIREKLLAAARTEEARIFFSHELDILSPREYWPKFLQDLWKRIYRLQSLEYLKIQILANEKAAAEREKKGEPLTDFNQRMENLNQSLDAIDRLFTAHRQESEGIFVPEQYLEQLRSLVIPSHVREHEPQVAYVSSGVAAPLGSGTLVSYRDAAGAGDPQSQSLHEIRERAHRATAQRGLREMPLYERARAIWNNSYLGQSVRQEHGAVARGKGPELWNTLHNQNAEDPFLGNRPLHHIIRDDFIQSYINNPTLRGRVSGATDGTIIQFTQEWLKGKGRTRSQKSLRKKGGRRKKYTKRKKQRKGKKTRRSRGGKKQRGKKQRRKNKTRKKRGGQNWKLPAEPTLSDIESLVERYINSNQQ